MCRLGYDTSPFLTQNTEHRTIAHYMLAFRIRLDWIALHRNPSFRARWENRYLNPCRTPSHSSPPRSSCGSFSASKVSILLSFICLFLLFLLIFWSLDDENRSRRAVRNWCHVECLQLMPSLFQGTHLRDGYFLVFFSIFSDFISYEVFVDMLWWRCRKFSMSGHLRSILYLWLNTHLLSYRLAPLLNLVIAFFVFFGYI